MRLLTIVSERRTVPAIMQLRRYWRNRKTTEKAEFENAVQAFWWTIASLIFPGGGSGGILTLVVAAVTVYLAYTANGIATQSNDLIERQISVEDASRHAAISAEVTAILDQINDYQIGSEGPRELPSTIIGRIGASTQMMKPYPQPITDGGRKEEYSPERTQLLTALLMLELKNGTWGRLLQLSDFSHVSLRDLPFTLVKTSNISPSANFRSASFEGVSFQYDTLIDADFSFTKLKKTNYYECNLGLSTFSKTQMENCRITSSSFRNCDFGYAVIANVNVDLPETFEGANFDSAIVDCAFYNTVLKRLNYPPSQLWEISR